MPNYQWPITKETFFDLAVCLDIMASGRVLQSSCINIVVRSLRTSGSGLGMVLVLEFDVVAVYISTNWINATVFILFFKSV